MAWKFGFGWPAAGSLVLTWFLIALTFIDVDHQLLPDCLTLPLLWLGLLLSLWARPARAAQFPVDLRSSIVGAIAGYLSLWSVYHLFRLLTGKEGMGYGDFKLFAALGAWLGWQMLLPIILLAAARGRRRGHPDRSTRRGQQRSTPIAFGPFLAAAGWLMLMFGPAARRQATWVCFRRDTRGMSSAVLRVGLTGGIASGKIHRRRSSSARWACPIIDTDQIARDVVEPGQPPLERLVERFGRSILHAPTDTSTGRALRDHRLLRSQGPRGPGGPDASGDRRAPGGALGDRRRPLPDPRHPAAGREKPGLAARPRAGGRLQRGTANPAPAGARRLEPAAGAGHPERAGLARARAAGRGRCDQNEAT